MKAIPGLKKKGILHHQTYDPITFKGWKGELGGASPTSHQGCNFSLCMLSIL